MDSGVEGHFVCRKVPQANVVLRLAEVTLNVFWSRLAPPSEAAVEPTAISLLLTYKCIRECINKAT